MGTTPRSLDDYVVGQSITTTGRTITEADVVLHAGQTGDFFPHHMDAEWSRDHSGFGQRIAHGTLILSVASGMLTSDINPLAFSYGYDQVRFVRPVFIGDTITITGTIAAKRDDTKRTDRGFADEKVVAMNQRDEVVLVFTHVYSVQLHKD
jgi:acyl dehydratase